MSYIVLIFQENQSYSLWVTAFDGSIPQRTEVYATVTDNSGIRPKIPRPPLPPLGFPPYPTLPSDPKNPFITQRTTKLTTIHVYETTVPEATEFSTPTVSSTKLDYNPEVEKSKASEETNNNSERPDTVKTSDMTVIPLVAIGALVVVVAGVIIFIWKKNRPRKPEKKDKDDMVSFVTIFNALEFTLILTLTACLVGLIHLYI